MRVTVIDYGIGNLFSVQRALEHCGASVQLSSNPDEIVRAERLVLPGVGAFADGMRGLRERNLIDPILQFAATQRPLLGICLGMQMLASMSLEFGEHAGLGLVPGRVVPVPNRTTEGMPQKTPHIGWSELAPAPSRTSWDGTALAGTRPGAAVYLVHSFHLQPDDAADALADCIYGGHRITAGVQRDSMIGCQFHPEKSGAIGLGILNRFLHF
jgi:glutamine amidotransferase